MILTPQRIWGGVWTKIAQGRTLVGVDPNDADFNAPNIQKGEKTHQLSIPEMPSHRHQYLLTYANEGTVQKWYPSGSDLQYGKYQDQSYMLPTGGDQPHNNLQPYFTCYIWLRTE